MMQKASGLHALIYSFRSQHVLCGALGGPHAQNALCTRNPDHDSGELFTCYALGLCRSGE